MFSGSKGGKGRYWTEQDDRLLLMYRSQGMVLREIANKLDRTRSAIHQRCMILKIDYIPPDSIIDERIRRIELITKPHKVADVAKILGITRRAVGHMKVRYRKEGISVYHDVGYRGKRTYKTGALK